MAASIVPQCGIYRITCTANGKIYIGSSSNIHRRWQEHRRRLNRQAQPNIHLQRAWNQYGEIAFRFSVLEICSENALHEREQWWLDALKDLGYVLFNVGDCAASPRRGVALSAETRAKLSAAQRGFKMTVEHREKLTASVKGRPQSEEHIARRIAGQCKVYVVVKPDGTEMRVRNLKGFCRLHGLTPGNMYAVACGKLHHHKGWKCRHVGAAGD